MKKTIEGVELGQYVRVYDSADECDYKGEVVHIRDNGCGFYIDTGEESVERWGEEFNVPNPSQTQYCFFGTGDTYEILLPAPKIKRGEKVKVTYKEGYSIVGTVIDYHHLDGIDSTSYVIDTKDEIDWLDAAEMGILGVKAENNMAYCSPKLDHIELYEEEETPKMYLGEDSSPRVTVEQLNKLKYVDVILDPTELEKIEEAIDLLKGYGYSISKTY